MNRPHPDPLTPEEGRNRDRLDFADYEANSDRDRRGSVIYDPEAIQRALGIRPLRGEP